jgi:hypothetical protein
VSIFDATHHRNRRERRDIVRMLPRSVRLAYGFGRWRVQPVTSMVIRTDGRQ